VQQRALREIIRIIITAQPAHTSSFPPSIAPSDSRIGVCGNCFLLKLPLPTTAHPFGLAASLLPRPLLTPLHPPSSSSYPFLSSFLFPPPTPLFLTEDTHHTHIHIGSPLIKVHIAHHDVPTHSSGPKAGEFFPDNKLLVCFALRCGYAPPLVCPAIQC